MSANRQTRLFARDKLKLVRLKAEGYLSSLMEEVKIIINWLSEDDELNQYHLRICWLSWIKAVVVASDMTHFQGRKIADITPRIIHLVSDYFDLCSCNIMLVEHYPSENLLDEDIYLHVLFKNNETMRYEIDEDELTRIIYYLL